MKNLAILTSFLALTSVTFAQGFSLPSLAYSYKDLEPNVDAQTMEIHHSKHHQGYVNNLNKAVSVLKIENKSLEDLLLGISRTNDAVRNNAGGHYNHSLFWEILTPIKNTKRSEALENAIKISFGSIDSLKKQLNAAASTRFGSGWAWLIINPEGKLQVCSTPNQDNPLMDINPERGIPILGIDVWEHAYYLKYQNKRGDYLSAIWEILNWTEISKRYEEGLKSTLLSYLELDSWAALKVFSKTLNETYLPAEGGDLEPIKNRSAELMLNAINVKASNIPKAIDSPVLRTNIDDLVKESNQLHKMIRKNMKDAVIKVKLFEVYQISQKIK